MRLPWTRSSCNEFPPGQCSLSHLPERRDRLAVWWTRSAPQACVTLRTSLGATLVLKPRKLRHLGYCGTGLSEPYLFHTIFGAAKGRWTPILARLVLCIFVFLCSYVLCMCVSCCFPVSLVVLQPSLLFAFCCFATQCTTRLTLWQNFARVWWIQGAAPEFVDLCNRTSLGGARVL